MIKLAKKLYNETYKFSYWIIVADTIAEGVVKLGKLNKCIIQLEGNPDDYGALTFSSPIGVVYSQKHLSYSVIAHESFHVVDMRLSAVGVELASQSCETFAYLLDEIVGNTIVAMRAKRVKIKDK